MILWSVKKQRETSARPFVCFSVIIWYFVSYNPKNQSSSHHHIALLQMYTPGTMVNFDHVFEDEPQVGACVYAPASIFLLTLFCCIVHTPNIRRTLLHYYPFQVVINVIPSYQKDLVDYVVKKHFFMFSVAAVLAHFTRSTCEYEVKVTHAVVKQTTYLVLYQVDMFTYVSCWVLLCKPTVCLFTSIRPCCTTRTLFFLFLPPDRPSYTVLLRILYFVYHA